MSMKIGIFAAAAMICASGAVAAQPTDEGAEQPAAMSRGEQASTATAAAAESEDEKKICRTERATGSLTRRTRVCMTAAQWREINAKTMRGVSEMQGQGSGGQVVQNNAGSGG
jgi:hypothetical protein